MIYIIENVLHLCYEQKMYPNTGLVYVKKTVYLELTKNNLCNLHHDRYRRQTVTLPA